MKKKFLNKDCILDTREYSNKQLKSLMVYQANEIANGKHSLNLRQIKLLKTIIASIDPKKDYPIFFTVNIKDFADFANLGTTALFRDIVDLLRDFTKKTLEVDITKSDGTPGIFVTHFIAGFTYFKGSGKAELCIDPRMIPFLTQLQGNFFRYKLPYILSLKSIYSIRIYELLKSYQRYKSMIFKVSQLRKILDVEHKYPDYWMFRKKTILAAQKELKAKTDIRFTFSEERLGHSVHSIRFNIFPNPKQQESKTSKELPPVTVTKFDPETGREYENIILKDCSPSTDFLRHGK